MEFQITSLVQTPAPDFTLSPATLSQCLKTPVFRAERVLGYLPIIMANKLLTRLTLARMRDPAKYPVSCRAKKMAY